MPLRGVWARIWCATARTGASSTTCWTTIRSSSSPAIRPDVALFHAAHADRAGNVWIGVRRELMRMAHAARTTLVTVEEITHDDLLADDATAARDDPGPLCHRDRPSAARCLAGWSARIYPADLEHLRQYAELARDDAGFARYLDEFVFERALVAE